MVAKMALALDMGCMLLTMMRYPESGTRAMVVVVAICVCVYSPHVLSFRFGFFVFCALDRVLIVLVLGFLAPTLVLIVIPPLLVPCPTPTPLLRRALVFGTSGVVDGSFFLCRGSSGFLFMSTISNVSARKTGEVIVELEAVLDEVDVGDGSDEADDEKVSPVNSTGAADEDGIASSGTVSSEGEKGMVIPCSRSLPLEAM